MLAKKGGLLYNVGVITQIFVGVKYMAQEPKDVEILDEKDFFEQEVIIRKHVLGSTKLTGAEKKTCLTVLEGVSKSVKVRGARQHGITKKMLATSFEIFSKMAEDKRHNDKEIRMLKMLSYIIFQGMHSK